MADDVLIRVEGVSKKFSKSLSRSMLYGLQDIGRAVLSRHPVREGLRGGEFWALKDVSFELKRGEALGLIGPNGAGKSTLLKILNGILSPDEGRVEINGRIGGLIEVGAGFHPMLTGRENVYVNGSILGFSKRELDERFDEIVEFSQLAGFIDTPLKHYSSGMVVRLGFAIAAQMKPDVLLIDEVLAVGDAGFRGRCYRAISSLAENSAVIFVSHHMPSIASLCDTTMVFERGRAVFQGGVAEGVQSYLSLFGSERSEVISDGVSLRDFSIKAETEKGGYVVPCSKPLEIEMTLSSDRDYEDGLVHLDIIALSGEFVAEFNSGFNAIPVALKRGEQTLSVYIDSVNLNPGNYSVSLVVSDGVGIRALLWVHHGWSIKVAGERFANAPCQLSGKIEISSHC